MFCKKGFLFATSPCCGHSLTCFARKGCPHRRLVFPRLLYQIKERVRSPSNSGVLVRWINSELVHFKGYWIIWQNTSRYEATIGSYLLRIRGSHWRCSVRKGVLRNFTKFTGKHLRQSLFFNKVAGHKTPLDDCFCRIEKKSAFFSGSKEIPQKNAILSQENM